MEYCDYYTFEIKQGDEVISRPVYQCTSETEAWSLVDAKLTGEQTAELIEVEPAI